MRKVISLFILALVLLVVGIGKALPTEAAVRATPTSLARMTWTPSPTATATKLPRPSATPRATPTPVPVGTLAFINSTPGTTWWILNDVGTVVFSGKNESQASTVLPAGRYRVHIAARPGFSCTAHGQSIEVFQNSSVRVRNACRRISP